MDPERWRRLTELFEQAREMTHRRREAFLEHACGDDTELRTRLEALLAADTAGSGTLERGIGTALGSLTEAAGQEVGPYRLVAPIGEGGMGSVWRAVRSDDAYEKVVAVKFMHRGLHSPELRARFQAERQILATLEHPGIARVVDGGTTESGAPYVVMEHVEGLPLDRYCDAHRLDTTRRLRLFRQVCAAVSYAHRNLVVHRDLKPANILVTPEGVPKLLDFGIAKLLDPAGAPHPVAETATATRLMTPRYASPEQVRGQPVTTASDVYSLGVVLYELLTGHRPYRLRSERPGEMEKVICEQEPERPSSTVTRDPAPGHSTDPELTTAAGLGRARGSDPPLLRKRLSGDLDNIVLKAMRKEPELRYTSAEGLSGDIQRHLQGLPVLARPSTLGYRAAKFLRRHPLSSAAAALFVATIIGFTTVIFRQNMVVGEERDRAVEAEAMAQEEADSARATARFMVNLFRAADPRNGGNVNMTARDVLVEGIDDLLADRSMAVMTRLPLIHALAHSVANLGDLDSGIRALEGALAESEEVFGRDSLDAAQHLHRLGDMLRRAERFDEAYACLTEALEIRQRHMEGDSYEIADSYNNLSILMVEMGDLLEADRMQRESVAMHRRMGQEGGGRPGTPLNNLALLRRRQGRLEEARALSAEAIGYLEASGDAQGVLLARAHIATIDRMLGRPEEALAALEAARDGLVELVGPDNRRTLRAEREIAETYRVLGQHDRARAALDALEPRIVTSPGGGPGEHARLLFHRGLLLRDMGDLAGAEAALRQALPMLVETLGARHYSVPGYRRLLAALLLDQVEAEAGPAEGDAGGSPGDDRLAEAGELLAEARAAQPDPEAYPHVETARIAIQNARLLRLQGRLPEARNELDRARAIIEATTGPSAEAMGLALLEQARLEEAAGS